jgi:hypothetical protein
MYKVHAYMTLRRHCQVWAPWAPRDKPDAWGAMYSRSPSYAQHVITQYWHYYKSTPKSSKLKLELPCEIHYIKVLYF